MKNSAAQILENTPGAEQLSSRRDTSMNVNDIALVKDVPVKMAAHIGSATLTIEKLFSLKPGDVVELNERLEETVIFYMGDKPVARGNLMAVGDQYGVELVEIL